MTEKEIMALWRGIPANYIALAAGRLDRGAVWSGCPKGYIARAIVTRDAGIGGTDPAKIAELARQEQEQTQKMTAEKRRIRAQFWDRDKRRAELSPLTSAQLDAAFKALKDRDLAAEGARVTLTKDWYNRRTAGVEALKRALVQAGKDYKINLIVDLEIIMRAAQTVPAVKEASDA